MEQEQEQALALQMYESYKDDPDMMDRQNHGAVTGNEMTEDTVEDTQLAKAVEILRADTVWETILEKYHKAVSETQMAAESRKEAEFEPEQLDAAKVLERFQQQPDEARVEDEVESELGRPGADEEPPVEEEPVLAP